MFVGFQGGSPDIYVIDATGKGGPRRLTIDPARDTLPSWSKNGRSVYFGSTRTGKFEIWKVPADVGESEQVTTNGGVYALESDDGRSIYFSRVTDGKTSLWKMSLDDEKEMLVCPVTADYGNFYIVPEGVYYKLDESSLEFLDFETGQSEPVMLDLSGDEAGERYESHLSVSPDGKWLLLTKVIEPTRSDLMLVDNFR